MNSFTAFFKKLQLRQILTVFLAGILLFTTSITFNNSQYSLEVNSDNTAFQDINSQFLVATAKSDGLLYPGAETPAGRIAKEKELPIKGLDDTNAGQPGGFNQRKGDLGDRVGGRLDAVKESVKEASSFLGEKAEEAKARPEIQKNPAVGR